MGFPPGGPQSPRGPQLRILLFLGEEATELRQGGLYQFGSRNPGLGSHLNGRCPKACLSGTATCHESTHKTANTCGNQGPSAVSAHRAGAGDRDAVGKAALMATLTLEAAQREGRMAIATHDGGLGCERGWGWRCNMHGLRAGLSGN